MRLILKFVHLFSMIIWFGGVIFLSFFVAPFVFKAFPRDQAGDIMGAIFPGFYIMGTISGFIVLVTLFLISQEKRGLRSFFIMIMLLATLYGGWVVGKKANHLRQEIKFERDASRLMILKNDFHTQHRLSMISNLVVLILIPTVVLLTARQMSES